MNPQAHDPHPIGPEPETLSAAQQAEMERELSALTIAEPTPLLDHRVAAALRDGAPAPTTEPADVLPMHAPAPVQSHGLTWLAVAAVVALLAALGLGLYIQGTATPTPNEIVDQAPDTPAHPHDGGVAEIDETPAPHITQAGYAFEPDPVKLRWTRDLDQGLLTSDAGQPVRAIRRQDVEQEVWIDRERGVTVQITRPTERLVVIKQPTF
ncbi:hypothetical protein OT109_07130 [Phycisphaeraceae bacterium D3-23]